MAKLSLKAGTTSKMLNVFFQDSSKTTGAGLAGISNNSSGLLAHFIRENDSASTPIAIVSAAIGTYTTGGIVEIESSAMPGLYQIGLPNAVCSAGTSKSVVLYYTGATNLAPCLLEIELTQVDNQDSVRYGMTALPNAAANAANGLLTAGTGANQISTSAGAMLVQSGTAAGQILASAGSVSIDWAAITNKTASNVFTQTTISSVSAAVTITSNIKKNQIVSAYPFVMTDNATHSPRTSLTVSANRSLDGGAFAPCANNVTELANGVYNINLAAADLNANTVMLRFVSVSADDLNIQILTQP